MSVKCSSCGHEHEDWVPKARLETVTEQRKAAKAEAKAAEERAAQIEAQLAEAGNSQDTIDSLNGRIKELEAAKGTWELQKTIMGAGITDPEGLSVISTLWSALPEDKRPDGGVSEWLTGDSAPKAAKAYMVADTQQGETEAETKTAEVQTRAGLPNANSGIKQSSNADGQFTAQRIAQMTPAEYAQHREAIRAARGLAPIESETA